MVKFVVPFQDILNIIKYPIKRRMTTLTILSKFNGTMRKYTNRSGFDYQGRHKTKEAALTTAVDDKSTLNIKKILIIKEYCLKCI